jgi:transketolase
VSINIKELQAVSKAIRTKLVEMSHVGKTPHLGSSLSCVDIVTAAYWGGLKIDPKNPLDPNRDRLLFSKGHAATTLYAALAFRGYFSEKLLDDYAKPGAVLGEHPSPDPRAPGIEVAAGSLGHGLSLALGMALAARIESRKYKCCVVMSDGECNEGSVWEAAMLGASQKLDNVVIVIDYNKWQATGRSNEVLALAPLKEKWEAMGWSACEVDGHDLATLVEKISNVPNGTGKPVAVIAHTVKGKGVSFMEDDNNWHYRIPSADELRRAREELQAA